MSLQINDEHYGVRASLAKRFKYTTELDLQTEVEQKIVVSPVDHQAMSVVSPVVSVVSRMWNHDIEATGFQQLSYLDLACAKNITFGTNASAFSIVQSSASLLNQPGSIAFHGDMSFGVIGEASISYNPYTAPLGQNAEDTPVSME